MPAYRTRPISATDVKWQSWVHRKNASVLEIVLPHFTGPHVKRSTKSTSSGYTVISALSDAVRSYTRSEMKRSHLSYLIPIMCLVTLFAVIILIKTDSLRTTLLTPMISARIGKPEYRQQCSRGPGISGFKF